MIKIYIYIRIYQCLHVCVWYPLQLTKPVPKWRFDIDFSTFWCLPPSKGCGWDLGRSWPLAVVFFFSCFGIALHPFLFQETLWKSDFCNEKHMSYVYQNTRNPPKKIRSHLLLRYPPGSHESHLPYNRWGGFEWSFLEKLVNPAWRIIPGVTSAIYN